MLDALAAPAFLLIIRRIPVSAINDAQALSYGYTQGLRSLPILNTLTSLLAIIPLTLLFYKLLAQFLDQRPAPDAGRHPAKCHHQRID